MPSRVQVSIIVIIMMAAMALPMATAGTTASPTVELSMDIDPPELYLFPTYAQIGTLELQGNVTCDKTRPDEIRVYIEALINVPWDFMIQPEVMIFRGVGERMHQFKMTLSVPPRTAGPPVVTMEFRADADLAGRTVDCTAMSVLHIVQDVNGFIESIPEEIHVPPDKGVDGTVYIENLLDEELEVHIGATGDWNALLLDMDFQQPIVMQPYEQRPAQFHGRLSNTVEPGDYLVELALWTPGGGGERMVITTANVTFHVMEDPGNSFGDALLRSLVPLLLVGMVAAGLATFWFLKRKDRVGPDNHIH
ncbi:MAG: hypothetical protein KAQ96_14785 [Thermoplasmata archaeon]|nr:hypothetical protein [Thermoplasmata archaeon]